MTNIITSLNWRYATKKYDSAKKISQEKLDTILESIRLAPSSYGLQPFTVINVTNTELRQKLIAAAYGQTQVTDASNLLVFTVPTNLNSTHIEQYTNLIAKVRQVPSPKDFADNLNRTIVSNGPEKNINWSARQAYIALGVAMVAAAIEEVDSTPMEGFNPAQIDEILGLKDKNLTSIVLLALGTRSIEDKYAQLAKVRKSKDELFIKM